VTGLLDRLVERTDDILRRRKFPMLVCPPVKILAKCSTGDGHVVSVDELVLK
jgi:hypothetical protein